MIRVFARKTFGFKNYTNQGDSKATVAEAKAGVPLEARTKPLKFADLPDWVQSDPMFQWAVNDGDITVVKDLKGEKETEKKAADEEGKTANEQGTKDNSDKAKNPAPKGK